MDASYYGGSGAPNNTMTSYASQQSGGGGGGYGGGGGGGYNNQQQYHQQQVPPHSPHHHPQHPQEIMHDDPQQQQQSMTIDEMRILHRTALAEAEAKRTELRLVLASRYRELVGSSDEVIHMRERAEELNDLVLALPELVEKVTRSAEVVEDGGSGSGSGSVGVSGDNSSSTRKLFQEGTSSSQAGENAMCSPQDRDTTSNSSVEEVRAELSRLPRDIHQCLDENNVHGAAASLIALFDIIASRCGGSCSKSFPLATALASTSAKPDDANGKNGKEKGSAMPKNPLLETQIKMVYLHVQTLPTRTVKLARRALLHSAGGGVGGAHATAAALSALDLLDIDRQRKNKMVPKLISGAASVESSRATKLIDLYYESKASLLNKLLNKLTLPSTTSASVSSVDAASVTNRAEVILSKIVMILQYDVILYPYQIFILRKFRVNGSINDGGISDGNSQQIVESIMSTLPPFDPDLLKSKASRFLAAHLPLIRTKVKSVLMIIAGTTASKLGQIRQTLYDKTDGAECMVALDESGVCKWDEAVGGMVDVRVVSHGTTFASTSSSTATSDGSPRKGSLNEQGTNMNGQSNGTTSTTTTTTRRFSLWGALFSNTFSSLVHSLLTTSFHSVHVRVVSTLRTSLARAPPHERMLPHEAHRNALRIATDLDASLRRVSDDAHELLVHAEEREESERRLRQSLYVQTCEIMGRLLNELRRMLVVNAVAGGIGGNEEKEDATKVLIVGRLCHLLKFRLKSLPTLLDPKSSPAVMLAAGFGGGGGKSHSGMITLMELSSSFDLADDDDDGLISFDEAMEAMESAFSGTHFHGAEMVRDTLLLAHSSSSTDGVHHAAGVAGHGGGSYAASNAHKSSPQNVTLSELALLSARGLRHDASGPESALGTVQSSLDDIVRRCFEEWARAALALPLKSFTTTLRESICVASSVSDVEWRRLNGLIDKDDDALLKEVNESKGDERRFRMSHNKGMVVGEVSPHVVSYLLAVAGILNRSVCPADSLPPVPSLEYAKRLGISSPNTKDEEIPNMMVTIRGSLLGEAVSSVSSSLKQEILPSASEDDYGVVAASNDDDGNNDQILKKCSPSSLVQLCMDVKFIQKCFFDRNQHGFLSTSADSVNDSRGIMDGLSECLSTSMNDTLRDNGSSLSSSVVSNAMSERHSQVFTSCDLFLSSLFGEDQDDNFSTTSSSINGVGGISVLSSSQNFMLNPLPSSRRFILLPIQAEKSLTELQLRGKYGKNKAQEEKGSSGKDTTSGNALGTGFGFLSSMLTKNR